MTNLNERALEVAQSAFDASPDVAELVERLENERPANMVSVLALHLEAASLIQSQAARIAELEASIDRHTRFISSEYDDVPNVVSVTLSFDNGEEIDSRPFGDFRTARALLNRRAEG